MFPRQHFGKIGTFTLLLLFFNSALAACGGGFFQGLWRPKAPIRGSRSFFSLV